MILQHSLHNEPSYRISSLDIASITDTELRDSTDRLLPEWDSIPAQFKQSEDPYNKLATAIALGIEVPAGSFKFRAGFNDLNQVCRMVHSHLGHSINWTAEQRLHRIAGVAYMLSLVCEVSPHTAVLSS